MLRDEFARCPRCQAGLDARGARWVCGQCQGILIAEPEVSQLIADMLVDTVSIFGWNDRIAEPVPLPLEPGTAGETLTCPCCTAAMAPHKLHGLAVDRCAEHGLWFDASELQAALQVAATAGKHGSSTGEKVYAAIIGPALIATWLLQLITGRAR